MEIILSHRYLDFDALASMVAAQKLYPDALIVIEGSYNPFVQDFLALAKEHIPYYRFKDINIDKVKKIILVDTYELSRSVNNKKLLTELETKELVVIDHHPYPNQNKLDRKVIFEPLGACTSIIVEMLMKKGQKLSSFEATLMALGIYDDTGSLIFESTTSRDLSAVAYLLEQGAQLGVVAEYLRKPLNKEQMDIFQQLLDNGGIENFEQTPVFISYAENQEYLGGLALLAHRIGEIASADIWFIVVRMGNRVYIVGRARGTDFPVNKIVQAFGGSGHQKAASAVLKEQDVPSVISRLKKEILHNVQKPSLVEEIMSYPVKTVLPDTTIGEVSRLLLKYGHTGLPVVKDNTLIGIISRRDVDKALKHGLEHAPVKGFMTRDVLFVNPDQSWEVVQKLMVEHDIGRLPVVKENKLVGIVSRSDVLRLIYGRAVPTSSKLAKARSLARRENILDLIEQLNTEVRYILNIIRDIVSNLGYRAYLVGGFVRDLLLRFPTSDLDIVVEGDSRLLAEKLSEKLATSRLTVHESFGTANILLKNGFYIDIASSRREEYDFPGALPTVEESNLKDDLFRRDFTINAMALCLNEEQYGEIIDYYGGFRDLQQGEIRFLHNLSFIEDPTRILRAIRFAERYNFKIAKITEDAITTALEAGVLSRVSIERFSEELFLIYREPHYQAMGNKLIEYGIFKTWFGFDYPWNFKENNYLVNQWPLEKRWLLSIKNIDNDGIEKILSLLKLDKELSKTTLKYIDLRKKLGIKPLDLIVLDEILHNSPEVIINVFLHHKEYAQWIKEYLNALSRVKTKVTGKQLIQMGFKEGPEIGDILKKIRIKWMLGEINTFEEECRYIKSLCKAEKSNNI